MKQNNDDFNVKYRIYNGITVGDINDLRAYIDTRSHPAKYVNNVEYTNNILTFSFNTGDPISTKALANEEDFPIVEVNDSTFLLGLSTSEYAKLAKDRAIIHYLYEFGNTLLGTYHKYSDDGNNLWFTCVAIFPNAMPAREPSCLGLIKVSKTASIVGYHPVTLYTYEMYTKEQCQTEFAPKATTYTKTECDNKYELKPTTTGTLNQIEASGGGTNPRVLTKHFIDDTGYYNQDIGTIWSKLDFTKGRTLTLGEVGFTTQDSPTGDSGNRFEVEIHKSNANYGYLIAKHRIGIWLGNVDNLDWSGWREITDRTYDITSEMEVNKVTNLKLYKMGKMRILRFDNTSFQSGWVVNLGAGNEPIVQTTAVICDWSASPNTYPLAQVHYGSLAMYNVTFGHTHYGELVYFVA